MQYITHYNSPVGKLLLASDGENLTGLWIENQKYYGAGLEKEQSEQENLPVFIKTKEWLRRYFAGERPNPAELSLKPGGSVFRQNVLQILQEIPYGETITYGEIAKKIAEKEGKKSMSGQAVGGAVGHNPISIIIPCHRVVGSNGSLTGYAAGIDTKIQLLHLEGVETEHFYRP